MQRTGFVSNSSSSSFIVQVTAFDNTRLEHVRCLNPDKESVLVEAGFEYTGMHDPMWFEHGALDDSGYEPEDVQFFFGKYLGLRVSCNQDEIVQLLVTHDIPFHASVQYDEEELHWDGISPNIVSIQNYGRQYMMHGMYSRAGDGMTAISADAWRVGGNRYYDTSRVYI